MVRDGSTFSRQMGEIGGRVGIRGAQGQAETRRPGEIGRSANEGTRWIHSKRAAQARFQGLGRAERFRPRGKKVRRDFEHETERKDSPQARLRAGASANVPRQELRADGKAGGLSKKRTEIEEDPKLIPVYQDEVHFQTQTTVTSGWFKKGSRPKVKSFPGGDKVSYSGFVVPGTGRLSVFQTGLVQLRHHNRMYSWIHPDEPRRGRFQVRLDNGQRSVAQEGVPAC